MHRLELEACNRQTDRQTNCKSPYILVENERAPNIILNDTINLFFYNCNQHFGNFKP